jgi:DNA-binding PadR family transcriptional regulator
MNPMRPRSPLWMVVLALACEEPMHPYRMQTLIKQRGKDQIANVAQRNSVYQTIDALQRAGLIAALKTSREDRRPERTVYEATGEGRRALQSWVRDGLSTAAREFPWFPAALSTLYGIRDADDLRALLGARAQALEIQLAEVDKPWPNLPRIFLLESEYAAAVLRAEIAWLRRVMSDLQSGKLVYPSEEELRRIGSDAGGPSEDAIRRIAAEMQGSSPPRGSKARKSARASNQASASKASADRDKVERAKLKSKPSRRGLPE